MNSKSFLAITGLVIILLGTGTYMAMGSSNADKSEKADSTETAPVVDTAQAAPPLAVAVTPNSEALAPQPTAVTQASLITSLCKNGTYIASGTYDVPEGKTETIKVSITIKDDVIVDSSVTPSTSNDRESQRYQKQFIAGYKALVTGKKITDVKLSVVSGSSLTSSGWNSAVAGIEAQAKV